MKTKMNVSFSGGRTSAFMTKMLIDNFSHKYDFIVTFANTGLEHESTLQFIRDCDVNFGFNTIWLEACVYHNQRKGTGFKIVDFNTASRSGEPYEDVIIKYGIPNVSSPHCTRELKMAPIHKYLSSIGHPHRSIPTAIGIRIDETRRVSKSKDYNNIVYPLIDMFPADKQDVIDWWLEQDFNLEIQEWDGNCKGCFKKSFKKIFKQIDSDKHLLDFHIRMEQNYGGNGTNKDSDYKRVFFRNYTSAKNVVKMYINDRETGSTHVSDDMYKDSGCSESCEMFDLVS